MNQALVSKYDEHGEVSRGFAKVLSALQSYEATMDVFNHHVVRCWKRELLESSEPNWWQKVVGYTKEDVLCRYNLRASTLRTLSVKCKKGTLKHNTQWWQHLEGVAFGDKVEVARWYVIYDNLRNVIRNGEAFMLDANTCRFINRMVTHTSIFK